MKKELQAMLERFKKQVGEMMISFGEELTNQVEKTNERIDNLENEIKELKEIVMTKKENEVPKAESPKAEIVKVPLEREKEEKPKEPKKTRGVSKYPTEKDDLNILKKFSSKTRYHKINNIALLENGYLKSSDYENTIYIKQQDAMQDPTIYDITSKSLIKNLNKELYEIDIPKLKEFTENSIKIELTNEIINSIIKANEIVGTSENLSLYGVRFECTNNVLSIVSTDSYKMYFNQMPLKSNDFSFTINKDFVNMVKADLLKFGTNEVVVLEYDNNDLRLTYQNRVATSKCTDFAFCDYKSLIQRFSFTGYADMEGIDFAKLESICSLNGKYKNVAIFNIKHNSIECIPMDEIQEKNKEVYNIKDNTIEEIQIGLNVKWLSQIFKSMNTTKIHMLKNNSATKIENEGTNEFIILMPNFIKKD